jgi:xylulokinase
LITPHLVGTCNPDFNPLATGVIVGLRPTTNGPDLYKGILEGLACEFATMAELLERAVGPFHDIYATGGGCRSPLGMKLRAALAGRRLHRMSCPEAGCLGTAILAGVATRIYGGFSEAMGQLVQVEETIDPDPTLAQAYSAQLHRYRLTYSSLASVRDSSAALN